MVTAADLNIPRGYTPEHAIAVPFIASKGEKCLAGTVHVTDAMRYLQEDGCIFITHLRWLQDGELKELSRIKIVDRWIYATNLLDKLSVARKYACQLASAGRFGFLMKIPKYQRLYEELEVMTEKIERRLRHISAFCAKLAEIESDGRPLDQWPESPIPPSVRLLYPEFGGSPTSSIWVFALFESLRADLADGQVAQRLNEIMKDLDLQVDTLVAWSSGEWRKRVAELDRPRMDRQSDLEAQAVTAEPEQVLRKRPARETGGGEL